MRVETIGNATLYLADVWDAVPALKADGSCALIMDPPYHPTEKPVGLIAELVKAADREVVVDPFMGSGTTGVAAVTMGRRFIGIEIDPQHFETARERIAAAQKQQRLFA